MKVFIVLVSALLSLQVFAGTREDAYKICLQLPFQSDRDACSRSLRNYHYFDNAALAICDSLSFTSDKVACLPIIGDREYENYEIQNCQAQTFPNEKVNCLRNSGAPVQSGSCADKNIVLSQLHGAKQDMAQGRIAEADTKLNYLINIFQNCRTINKAKK